MTYEAKYLIELSDLLGIEIACQQCKAKIILTQESEKGMFAACPLCGVEWLNDETDEYKSLTQFVKLIRTAGNTLKGRKFSLKLEIASPPDEASK
jgi:hypothetical protein